MQYVCVQILVYGFCAFFISISQSYFDAVNQANAKVATSFTEAAPLVVICVIGILLLSQITMVAASIAGGIAVQSPRFGGMYSRIGAFGAAMGGSALGRKLLDRTGWTTPGERNAGRARARLHYTQREFEQSADYKRLAKKLTETA